MRAPVATPLLILLGWACHARGPTRPARQPRVGLRKWLGRTYANLRFSGALDSAAELRETFLARRLLEGRLDTAAYQRAMTELAQALTFTAEDIG